MAAEAELAASLPGVQEVVAAVAEVAEVAEVAAVVRAVAAEVVAAANQVLASHEFGLEDEVMSPGA